MDEDLLMHNYFKITISTILVTLFYILICLPFYFIPIIGSIFSRMLFLTFVTNYFYKICKEGLQNDVCLINNILPNENFIKHFCIYLISFCIYFCFEKISLLVNSDVFSILIFCLCFVIINIVKTSFIIFAIDNTNLFDGIITGLFLIFKRPCLYLSVIIIIYSSKFIPYCGICISYLLILFLEYIKISNYVNEKKYEY